MGPMSTSFGGAACSSLAATLTASPVTSRCPRTGSPAMTSPVFTPRRFVKVTPQTARDVLVQLRERAAHLGGRADGAQGIVLVHFAEPEHRHDRVPDELLDRAAVALEDVAHPVEVA